MPVAPRTPEAERQINEARKMPGYPVVKDHDIENGKDLDQLSGDARQKPESNPGAPSKLPGYR